MVLDSVFLCIIKTQQKKGWRHGRVPQGFKVELFVYSAHWFCRTQHNGVQKITVRIIQDYKMLLYINK